MKQTVYQRQKGFLLVLPEGGPSAQDLFLVFGQLHSFGFRKEFSQGDAEPLADLFQGSHGGLHVFPVPGGDGGLGDPAVLGQLVFAPVAFTALCGDFIQNVQCDASCYCYNVNYISNYRCI